MRVVLDATSAGSSWSYTGVARWTRGVISGLQVIAPDWDLRLIAMGRDDGREPAGDDLPISFTSRHLPARAQRLLLTARMFQPIERWIPDADVMVGSSFVAWPTERAARVPVIHDLTFVKHPTFVAWRNRLFLEALVKKSLAEATLVISVSAAVREEIIDHFQVPAERVRVVPNGCDLDRFHRGVSSPQMAEVPDRYLLLVGTLEPRKNVAGVLRALAKLRDSRADVPPLVIVGKEGWGRKSWAPLLDAGRGSGQAIHLGPVDDEVLASLYVGAEMLVFPSFYEGFGLPVLEALACGCPVVASDLAVLREVAGDAATYVGTDPESIAAGIVRLLDDEALRRSLAEAGPERARSFTWERSARMMRDALTPLAAR